MFFIVYKITNNVNKKYYIGKHQTKNINDGYMGSGKLIIRAIRKYGIENFTKEILHVFESEEEMNDKEKELVVISEETYNLCEGGKGGFGYINLLRKKGIIPYHIDATKTINSKIKREKTISQRYNNFYANIGTLGRQSMLKLKTDLDWVQKCKDSHLRGLPKNHQRGSKNSQFGKRFKYMNNGIINKKVLVEDCEKYIACGFKLGRI